VRSADIIHAGWFLPSGFIACLCKYILKKPVVTSAFGAEFHLPERWGIPSILRFVGSHSDSLTANSLYLAKRAQSYGLNPEKFHIIPTAINFARYASRTQRIKNKCIIAACARLIPAKRTEDLLHAASHLPQQYRDKMEIWIIGDGPQLPFLKGLAKQYQIEPLCKFFGMIPHGELPDLLSQIHIFVNPTVSDEGMPTINIEAMAMGAYPVASLGFSNEEVITDGITGNLFTPKDAQGLANILKYLLDNPQRVEAVGEAAQSFVRRNHSIDSSVERYLAIYESLLHKTRDKKKNS